MLHLDLFSGIGGFALAARWCGFTTIGFSEIDEYCCKVLKRHWPDVPNYGDVGDVPALDYDLLTAGPPCQPFSVAGKRRGQADDRDLWPSVLRIVRRDNPDWALIENVVNLKNMGLAAWRDDLAKAGYLTEVFDIPACAVGLPTVERHLWIVAQSRSLKLERGCEKRLPDINELQQCKRREAGSETPQRPYRPSLPRCRLHRSRKGIPNFVERIRGIGNAINPQVAYQIMRHMK